MADHAHIDSLNEIASRELDADDCYCGRHKQQGQSFCSKCYFELPRAMRRALYNSFSGGYASDYDAAKDWLRCNSPRVMAALGL